MSGKPWVEKYRPKSVTDLWHQEEVVKTLSKYLEIESMNNLLFYGPPGTGKTSAIKAFVNNLYIPELRKTRILELNASDERGISVIRTKIKDFAKTAANSTYKGKKVPAFKIVILDEVDAMTRDAQTALRRTMEATVKSTRFCLICNYISKIISPIVSRCAKFRFEPVSEDAAFGCLDMICKKEGVEVSEQDLRTLVLLCEGDLRKAITYLQSSKRLHGEGTITSAMFYDVVGVIPAEKMDETMEILKLKSHTRVCEALRSLLNDGYAAVKILSQLNSKLLTDGSIGDLKRSRIAEVLGEVEKRITVDGADEYVQLLFVFTTVMTELA